MATAILIPNATCPGPKECLASRFSSNASEQMKEQLIMRSGINWQYCRLMEHSHQQHAEQENRYYYRGFLQRRSKRVNSLNVHGIIHPRWNVFLPEQPWRQCDHWSQPGTTKVCGFVLIQFSIHFHKSVSTCCRRTVMNGMQDVSFVTVLPQKTL